LQPAIAVQQILLYLNQFPTCAALAGLVPLIVSIAREFERTRPQTGLIIRRLSGPGGAGALYQRVSADI